MGLGVGQRLRPWTFVYLNTSGDQSLWTSRAWNKTFGLDLAFMAFLS
jgi:hypothetical protein